MRNHSYENDFDLHENETACRTHFHMKGFALTLVLKQRHKRTRKWPIEGTKNQISAWGLEFRFKNGVTSSPKRISRISMKTATTETFNVKIYIVLFN